MKKLTMQIGQLFDLFNFNNEVNNKTGDVLNIEQYDLKVETPTGEFVLVENIVKKPKGDILELETHNGKIKRVSRHHLFSNAGEEITAEDCEYVDTRKGHERIIRKEFLRNDYLYDISIPAPHWYLTPDDIINHNSFIGLSILKNAQKKGMFCVIIDTEKAFDYVWAKSIGIDTSEDRLMVLQSNRIEKIQEKIVTLMNSLSKEEQQDVFLLLDSWGGLVTSKSVDDAAEGKDVLDMTEAKKKNKLAKLLMGSSFTGFVVNHVYDNIGGFGDPLKIPGGRGLYFASSCILMSTSKAKDGKGDDMTGVIVRCKTQKSRKSKEFMDGEYRIKRNGGLDRFYGLLDNAMDLGFVVKPSNGWYTRPFIKDDKKYRESELYTQEFWLPIFKDTDFLVKMEEKYAYTGSVLDVSNEIDWEDE